MGHAEMYAVHLQRRLHSQENNVQRGWTGEEAKVGKVVSGKIQVSPQKSTNIQSKIQNAGFSQLVSIKKTDLFCKYVFLSSM